MSLDPSTAPSSVSPTTWSNPTLVGVKAVFFDLDDTLCAYWDAAKQGLRRAFHKSGLEGVSVDDLVASWSEAFRDFAPTIKDDFWYPQYLESGESTRYELMRLALARLGIADEASARSLSDSYSAERNAALELFPESLDVLNALRKNFRLGLITNGPADIQRQEVETLGIESFFDYVLIEGELGFGKPDPRVMRRAEELSGCSGREILFVGNSFGHDIKPAQASGWRQAWIRRDSDVAPSSKSGKVESLPEGAQEPDLTIQDLRELLPALGLR